MKSKILRTSIGSVIFLSLIIATVAITEPLYRFGKEKVSDFETKIVSLLEEKTGLSISYESLSPSILSKIDIKGIVVRDAETKEILFNVKKTSLSYNFFSEDKKISLLSVDGVTFQFDAIKNGQIVEKFMKLMGENKKDSNDKFDFTAIKLPFDIRVKNVSVVYSDEKNDLRLFIRKVSLNQNETHSYLDSNISGSFRYRNKKERVGKVPLLIGSNYSLFARILPDLNDSYAILNLSALSGVDLTFNSLEMLLSYSGKNVVLQSTAATRNLDFVFSGDIEKSTVDAKISAASFKPLELFKYRTPNIHGEFFKNISINIEANAFANLSDLEKPKFNYNFVTSAFLPKREIYPDFYGELNFSGDETQIVVTNGFIDSEMVGGEVYANAEMPKNFDLRKVQPTGIVTIDHWILPNRTEPISCEIYVEPTDEGFMCFAPQVFLGELSYTALQVNFSTGTDSLDFIVDMDDYSHPEYEVPGHINLDGSFIFGQQNYMQMTGTISNMFVDSAMRFVGFCNIDPVLGEKFTNAASSFEPYISTDEIYFSSDYKNISYNAPYCLAANTKNEKELLMLSFDGSRENFNISSLSLLFNGHTMNGNGMLDMSDASKAKSKLFSVDFSINSIPYFINGSYSDNILNISGDYNLDASFEVSDATQGFLRFENFPIQVYDYAITMDLDSSISFLNKDEFSAVISNFSFEEPSGKLLLNPSIRMSGIANQYGLVMDEINYQDNVSVLNGSGSILWNISDLLDEEMTLSAADKITRILDSAHLTFDIQNPISTQRVSANCDITNPSRERFGAEGWKDKFEISADAAVVAFPIGAFIPDQMLDNTLSASVLITGTLENPIVTGVLENISLTWWGIPFIARGSVLYDTDGITVTDANASWYTFKLEDGMAFFDTKTYNGNANAKLGGTFWGNSLDAPIEVSLDNTGEKPFELYTMIFNFPRISGSLLKSDSPFKLTVMRNEGRFDFFTNDDGGITASIVDGGLITGRTGENSPFRMNVDGILGNNYMDLSVSDVLIDMGRLSRFVRLPQIDFNSGNLRGNIRAVGLPNDPELTGAFQIQKFSMSWDGYLAQPLEADKITITVGQGTVSVPNVVFKCGKGRVDGDAKFFLDRWRIDDSLINLKTRGKSLIPLNMKLPFLVYTGDGALDAKIKYNIETMDFDGSVFVQNGDINFNLNTLLSGDFTGGAEGTDDLQVNFKGDINFGTHLQFYVDPLIRGLVNPNTKLDVEFNNDSGDFKVKGDVEFRGGDITYLNRNFYMREGKLGFNENQDKIDPLVSVRAEARERDSDGNPVRIILTAKNQPFSTFQPVLSSSPAKSEREIMEIMGQIISGDSSDVGSLLMSGGDYIMQTTVVRKIEDTLRKMLNFDIFSIRTMVLQNAVKQGLNLNRSDKQVQIGNFFDNSTVYIGKYFGSSIYVDALMHWTYDENKTNDEVSAGGLVFQPEFGFEMTSPYVAIRLGLAPDFESMKNDIWVPAASITLSWKFNF